MNSADSSPLLLIQPALRRQQFRSERLRVRVFVVLLAFLLLIAVALRLMPVLVREDLRPGLFATFPPLAFVILVFLGYELGILLWFGRLTRSTRLPGAAFPYLNSLVEVSMPTAAIVAGAGALGGLSMLAGVVPFIYFLLLGLSALTLNPRLCLFAGAVAAAQFLATSLLLLRLDPGSAGFEPPLLAMLHSPHQYIIKSLILLVGGAIAAFVARQIKLQLVTSLHSLQERDRAVSIFGQHVSPQVAELLLRQPVDLAGQERQVCVMFLDIRDFSRHAASHSPSEVMDYLNTLFSFMIPLINDHHGIINKFLGDGFMAVFGAPLDDSRPCLNAVRASRAILDRVQSMNDAGEIPPTRLGIGLHLGTALTGNVGGGDRKEYTVIGDVVNLAARIEQATKTYQARLLVSDSVHQALQPPEGQDLGLVELKGQPHPVRLFKLA